VIRRADRAQDRPAHSRLRHAVAPVQERHAHHGRRADLLSIAVSTLLWFDLSNRFVWIVLLVTLGFGAIGWVDDWRKVVNKDPEGMRSREKYFWQSVIGLVAALYLVFSISESSNAKVLELFVSWVQSGFSLTCRPRRGCMVPFFKRSATRWACWALSS
jgi:hypothetical protein